MGRCSKPRQTCSEWLTLKRGPVRELSTYRERRISSSKWCVSASPQFGQALTTASVASVTSAPKSAQYALDSMAGVWQPTLACSGPHQLSANVKDIKVKLWDLAKLREDFGNESRILPCG